MCKVSKIKLFPCNLTMEDGIHQRDGAFSVLLELSAADDLNGFKCATEEEGFGVDDSSLWYGRRIGSKKMGLEERTPLMIASMYGSTEVLKYIIGTRKVDVNRACGSDGATGLHCASACGSDSSVQVVKLLIDASADINSLDVSGNKPRDVIARNLKRCFSRKTVEMLLKGEAVDVIEPMTQLAKAGGSEKKEYLVDVSLPDINTGIYGADEFRMFCFKVKPCSRAYSHDWTECPFVHPGENARRRDPRKYHYTCVPCPEFRKGSCAKGDSCEYAHGVFESWLHPAQYKTRLCKDGISCSRKVCFFAHKPEELRPLYASTGSAMPSPNSVSGGAMDLSSSSLFMPSVSTLPMSPVACSSPMGGSANLWQNKVNLTTPPTVQIPGSRLNTGLRVRDLELEMELLGLEALIKEEQQRQQLIEKLSSLSSPSRWNNSMVGDLKPTNLDNVFGSVDPSLLYQRQGLSPRVTTTTTTTLLQSPNALSMHHNMNHFRSSYPTTNLSSSPVRKSHTNGFDSSAAVAEAVMNSRSSALSKRSQSFIDPGAVNHHHRPGSIGFMASASLMSSNLSGWGSPDGKLEWGFHREVVNKLKKSASFGFRGWNDAMANSGMVPPTVDEPDVLWVNSLVKDVSSLGAGLYSSEQKRRGVNEALQPWVEHLYTEQEHMAA